MIGTNKVSSMFTDTSVKEVIPYGRQDISAADVKAVLEVLQGDFLTQGPAVPAFEKAVTDHVGVEHALAMNSATSALHAACLALEVGTGDLVWTSPITFVASSNCALYCGADVDFVDIDPVSYNMSVTSLRKKLAQAKASGRLPKLVIPVHLCGQPCDMEGIHALGREFGFRIIEDASHAIGGSYKDGHIGNCKFSDITIFSFHPVKIITTGEGGMAVTNDAQLAKRMGLFRSHGITRDEDEMTQESDGPWYYQQVDLGYNYRMTDLQAALGASQMTRLDAFVDRRHQIAARYNELLKDLPVMTPEQHPDAHSAFHLYVILLKEGGANERRRIFEGLRAAGIGVQIHYIPVHTQPYYQKLGFKIGTFPIAEDYYARAISIPMYATLSNEQQDRVVQTLRALVA